MPRNQLKSSVQINLEGNLEKRSRQYEQALQRMAQRGAQQVSLLSRSASLAGRGLDQLGNRYVGLITGAGTALAVKQVSDLEERYTRLGNAFDLPDKKLGELKKKIFDVAQSPDINIDPSEIISAVEAIAEKTGDLNFAEKNLRNIGLAIQATGGAGKDIGELLAEYQKLNKEASADVVLAAFDTLLKQGKMGAFLAKDLAALGPRVASAYQSATKGTRDLVTFSREMGAALQVIRQGTGSSEQAATVFERVLSQLQNKKVIEELAANGIQVFDPKQPGAEIMRPINEVLLEVLDKSKGRRTILGPLFGDEAVKAFNALTPELIDKYLNAIGDGATTLEDSRRAAGTFNAAMTNLRTSWLRFADDNLSGPIKDLSGWLRGLDKDTVSLAFNTGKWVLAIGGAAVAMRKIFNLYQGVRGIAGALTGRGAAGALSKGVASGMKPVPVYVVNGMPGLGGGKGVAGKAAGMGMLGKAGAVGAAAVGGYAAGTLLYDEAIAGTKTGDLIGETIARTLAFFGNDEAQAAVDRMQKYEASLKVTVDDERVRVSRLEADDGFDIDADDGWSMP
nr:hypothetical protein 2 [Gammaproteobacteria bacterium]